MHVVRDISTLCHLNQPASDLFYDLLLCHRNSIQFLQPIQDMGSQQGKKIPFNNFGKQSLLYLGNISGH
jgi:hypothetical protein